MTPWQWAHAPWGVISWRWQDGQLAEVALGHAHGNRAPQADPFLHWLEGYLAGKPQAPPPLAPAATPFQARVRAALLAIPFGQTIRYGELARKLGTSPRAIGQALAHNPLPLVVPCHRVVAAGSLGGFSAGLEWKCALLAFERTMASAADPSRLRRRGGRR